MPYKSEVWIPYDPSTAVKADTYALVISSVVPRPIALISSRSKAGVQNLAPYSYFNAMGHNPPTICIGINRSPGRGGGKKDSLVNIEETGEFVVNIMSNWCIEAANHSCGDFNPDIDELAVTGLTPIPSVKVGPPRLKEAAVHMECKLRQVVDIPTSEGKPSAAIVIAEVVMFHVHEGVAGHSPTGKLVVDPVALQPIGRMGGTMYCRTNQLFDLGRPVQAELHQGPAQYTRSFKDKHPEVAAEVEAAVEAAAAAKAAPAAQSEAGVEGHAPLLMAVSEPDSGEVWTAKNGSSAALDKKAES